MLFTVTFILALAIFIVGIIFRLAQWVTVKIGPDARHYGIRTRIARTFKSLATLIFSRDILRVIRVFFFEVILQNHILKKDALRWVMHFSLFGGILLLFVFHALDGWITSELFSGYYPTVNPYLFLRNFLGALVLVGIVIAGGRRLSSRRLKNTTTPHDVLALVLLAIIISSGFFLEASQIVSEPVFDEMVEDYANLDDSEALEALQSYWAEYTVWYFPMRPT